MASHRYWRIYITAINNSQTGGTTGFSEVQLRESIAGADATGSGTASADSSFDGTVLPAKAVDNNNATSWASAAGSLPHWWKYDFGLGNAKDIVELVWRPRTTGGQQPVNFDLQWSDDDAVWTPLFKVRGYCDQDNGGADYTINTSSPYLGIMAETAVNKQAWRIVPTVSGAGVYAFSEIEMRASLGGVDQCTGGQNFGSSHFDTSGHVQSRAYDDNNATLGATANTNGTQWFGYLFPATVNIEQLSLRSRSDTAANQTPTAFTIEYWDGSAWQVAATFSGLAAWSLAETRTFDIAAPESARTVVFVTT
jgi:hypothetical protein